MFNYLKYNIPAPRYTSYPTIPFWNNKIKKSDEWFTMVKESFSKTNKKEGIHLYVHLPFCENLCTYCGCNRYITKNHSVEEFYVNAILKEWEMYLKNFSEIPIIREFHLGGGTPTFFHSEQLERLVNGILNSAEMPKQHDYSFEGHPDNTMNEHLSSLSRLGFNRISLGIQDFDPAVQKRINRIQTVEQIKKITDDARSSGFTSVNYDLIYGLPSQNEKSIHLTMQKVSELKPDRIAFYIYAHVPWLKPAQKSLEPFLPSQEVKMNLHLLGRKLLNEMGYKEVGMDHFALPEDELFTAFREKRLNRNFMGYTPRASRLLIGLGASSISDAVTGFIQNVKEAKKYESEINNGILPVITGHKLSDEDIKSRKQIQEIMCSMETEIGEDEFFIQDKFTKQLKTMEEDGLISVNGKKINVLEEGKLFLRNICLLFDRYYYKKSMKEKKFSQTV